MKCQVTLILLIGWVALSVIGYIRKDTIYKDYTVNLWTTPYFALVFEGIHDGIYPWDSVKDVVKEDVWQDVTDEPQPDENQTVEEEQSEEQEKEPEIKEFVNVDESYFDDAVFIGDSRTVGLQDYGGLGNSTFYATVGLNIYDMWTEKFCEVDGVNMTLEEALSTRQFGKVYFQIGINEMGRGDLDSFMVEYVNAVERFKELQPHAIIYVQGIMRVTQKKSESDPIFNNPGIQVRNERIAQLADNRTVFYIDMNEVVCDEQGNLRPELTFDGLHLYGTEYGVWVDFLKTKGIDDFIRQE